MSAREQILARTRAALGEGSEEPPAWSYEQGEPDSRYRRTFEPAAPPARAALFAERLAEHGSRLVCVEGPAALAAAIEEACRRHGAGTALIPADLPEAWRPAGLELQEDRPSLSAAELAQIDCALTGAALAVAETGTIVFDGGARQGRRALSLIPDLHLCVLEAGQLLGGVPEAIAALAPAARAGRALTLASGPSATSDIGFERVVGVHGPRRLEVMLMSAHSPPSDADRAERIR